MKIIIHISILLFLTACGSDSSIHSDVKWEITKEEPNEALSKNNLEVELNKKVDKSILKEIALEIREERMQFDNVWVFYQVSDMNNGSAWATTHFTPNLDVQILGSTAIQDKETSKTTDIEGDIIGKWRSEKSLMGAALILFKNTKGNLMMRTTFKDGGSMESEIVESLQNGKTKYQDDNKHGEYYMLESNGNLGMYGKNGLFDEAVKID